MIADIYRGGPVGVETLAAGLSEPRDTIEEVIEPYLIQLGLIARTARGRCLNGPGWTHLGLPQPKGAGRPVRRQVKPSAPAAADRARRARSLASVPSDRAGLPSMPPSSMTPRPELARRAFSDPAIAEAWAAGRAAIGEAYASGGLAGGVNPGDRRALHALIMQLKPERVLEIGTNVGASTLAMAQALRAVSAAARSPRSISGDVNDPREWQDERPCDVAARPCGAHRLPRQNQVRGRAFGRVHAACRARVRFHLPGRRS